MIRYYNSKYQDEVMMYYENNWYYDHQFHHLEQIQLMLLITRIDINDFINCKTSLIKNFINFTYLGVNYPIRPCDIPRNIVELCMTPTYHNRSSTSFSIDYNNSISKLNQHKLNEISVNYGLINDISVIENNIELVTINFAENNITDITPIKKLNNLESISFEKNDICDITPLFDKTKTTWLDLSFNGNIQDFTCISNLINIQEMYLNNCNIHDASFLSTLTKIEDLYLHTNNITDVSFLKNMKNLRSLYLSDNKITDISCLSELQKLEVIHIDGNNINDISCLYSMNNLIDLCLPISIEEQKKEIQKALPKCWLEFK